MNLPLPSVLEAVRQLQPIHDLPQPESRFTDITREPELTPPSITSHDEPEPESRITVVVEKPELTPPSTTSNGPCERASKHEGGGRRRGRRRHWGDQHRGKNHRDHDHHNLRSFPSPRHLSGSPSPSSPWPDRESAYHGPDSLRGRTPPRNTNSITENISPIARVHPWLSMMSAEQVRNRTPTRGDERSTPRGSINNTSIKNTTAKPPRCEGYSAAKFCDKIAPSTNSITKNTSPIARVNPRNSMLPPGQVSRCSLPRSDERCNTRGSINNTSIKNTLAKTRRFEGHSAATFSDKFAPTYSGHKNTKRFKSAGQSRIPSQRTPVDDETPEIKVEGRTRPPSVDELFGERNNVCIFELKAPKVSPADEHYTHSAVKSSILRNLRNSTPYWHNHNPTLENHHNRPRSPSLSPAPRKRTRPRSPMLMPPGADVIDLTGNDGTPGIKVEGRSRAPSMHEPVGERNRVGSLQPDSKLEAHNVLPKPEPYTRSPSPLHNLDKASNSTPPSRTETPTLTNDHKRPRSPSPSPALRKRTTHRKPLPGTYISPNAVRAYEKHWGEDFHYNGYWGEPMWETWEDRHVPANTREGRRRQVEEQDRLDETVKAGWPPIDPERSRRGLY